MSDQEIEVLVARLRCLKADDIQARIERIHEEDGMLRVLLRSARQKERQEALHARDQASRKKKE